MKEFYQNMIEEFINEHLRTSCPNNIARLLARETRGYPGMLGSLDRMH